jgi:hypothetical protein
MTVASTAWPSLLSAQQKAAPVIGYLSIGRHDPASPAFAAFREALGDSG